jgi:hypothetical protein
MKPTPMAMKISPAQKSFGARICMGQTAITSCTPVVMPAKAGIQSAPQRLRLRLDSGSSFARPE